MRKVIITVAPTGSLTTREQLPVLPITPREIAEASVECFEKGATIAHLHVRDPKTGAPRQDPELYKETIDIIRSETNGQMLICTTTGGGATTGATPEQRLCSIELKPELASLNVSSMNFGTKMFPNPPDMVEYFARRMKQHGVKPEIEAYDLGHLDVIVDLIKRGIIDPPLRVNFVMGVKGGIPATFKNLMLMREALDVPDLTTYDMSWMVTAIGKDELPLSVAALLMGGMCGSVLRTIYITGKVKKQRVMPS